MSLEFKLKRAENHETSTFCSDELTDGFRKTEKHGALRPARNEHLYMIVEIQ